MEICVRGLRAAAFLGTVVAVMPAQQNAAGDPQAARQRIVVREAGTDIVLPGVLIQLGSAEREEPHLVDGWLRRFGRRPAVPRTVRSDPDGRILLEGEDVKAALEFGPEYRLVDEQREQDVRVLRVARSEHRTVRVVDAAGKAMAGFAVTRKSGVGTVLTDGFGVARFAAAGGFPLVAPASPDDVFVPAYWIGCAEWPQVTVDGRGLDQPLRLQLPACVLLRLRFLRHGVPTAVPVDAAWLSAPVEHSLWGPLPGTALPQAMLQRMEPVHCRGIEVGPIEWRGAVRGEVRIGRRGLPFECTTLPAKGTVLDVDLETDPPRPQLHGLVRTMDRPVPTRVRIGALTDVGTFEDEVAVAADGAILAGFDAGKLRGTELRRFWIDGIGSASGVAVTVERTVPLRDGVLELGELVLAPHAPVLRGRVVDARGAPLPAAQVAVQGAASDGTVATVPARIDGDGRFVLAGPWFRDARGDVATAEVTASLEHRHPGQLAPQPPPFLARPTGPLQPGAEVELVVPDAATGAFAMVVQGAPQGLRRQLQVCLLDGNNQILLHDERLLSPGDPSVWHRGSIEAPVGRRKVLLREFNHVLAELEIDIQPTQPHEANAVQVHTVEWDAIARSRAIRAVDATGQVIPAARVHLRTAGHKSGVMPDASGVLAWLEPLQLRHAAYLIAPGMQVVVLPANASGDVTMVPAVPVTLRLWVAANEQLEGTWTVMFDPCEDTGMAGYGTPSADGVVQCAGPAPGRYHVAMFARFDQFARRVRVGTIDIAEHKVVPGALTIDAVALAALRVLQAEPTPKK